MKKNEVSVEKEHSCSFCGKSQFQVEKLVIGPEVYICNDCVDLCDKVIKDSKESTLDPEKELPTPTKIFKELKNHIIGQDPVLKIISVAAYNHMLRATTDEPDKYSKSNVLLVGPSGSGKTLICQTLAKIIGVPFTITDATSLTESGYVGDDVDTVITSLIENAGGDIELAQKGVIFIDEIDKIAKKSSTTKDVSGVGVQNGLLRMIEGAEINVPPNFTKSQNQTTTKVPFDTSNVLFIFGGAFQGIDKTINRRINKTSIGITAKIEATEVTDSFIPKDLEDYGMIKEFVGRISFLSKLRELKEKDLVRILKEPKNSLVTQFQNIFKKQNVDLIIDETALTAVAKKAMEMGTGARGLRTIMNNALLDSMFDIPGGKKVKSVVISDKVIMDGVRPLYCNK